jgi:hypothetical protein
LLFNFAVLFSERGKNVTKNAASSLSYAKKVYQLTQSDMAAQQGFAPAISRLKELEAEKHD